MEATVILLFIILSALAALIALLVFRRKPTPSVDQAAVDYADGLNLMLSNDLEGALSKFKDTVTKDSKNVDAYLKIGDIMRTLGRTERAINVHKYLTVRQGLTPKQHTDILKSLARDYQAVQRYDQALEVLKKVLEVDKSAGWAREMRIELYEALADWPKAFQTYKELKNRNGELKNKKLALYKVREGLSLSEKTKSEKEAQACYKEAVKIDPQGPAGYIALADSFKQQGKTNDALKVLKQFVVKVPEQSFYAFNRIKELLYEGGVYGEIENIYLEIIENQPDNLIARLALVENYEKKGELSRAMTGCVAVLEKDPENKAAKKRLVKLYHKTGDQDAALKLALELIDENLRRKDNFRFEIEELLDNNNEE